MNDPTGITFDSEGNLWVANYKGGSILMYRRAKLSLGGRLEPDQVIADPATVRGPNRLAFDRAGNLWVANYDDSSIAAFSANQLRLGDPGPAFAILRSLDGSISQPTGLGFDAQGNLWVTNQRNGTVISIGANDLASTGSPRPKVVIHFPGGPDAVPEAVTFDSEGRLWVALYGRNEVVGFSRQAAARSGSPSPEFELQGAIQGPIGLALDLQGHLWVTDSRAVAGYDVAHPAKQILRVTSSAVSLPHTPAFDAGGNLWVSSHNDTIAGFRASQLSIGTDQAPAVVIRS